MHFGVHDGDILTLARGVCERVFVSKYGANAPVKGRPVRPNQRAVVSKLWPFFRALKKRSFGLTPWSYDKFVETRGRKRRVYEGAQDVLAKRGLRPGDSVVSTFVKAEKINLTAKPDPDPRVIQPRSAVYNICVGVYIAPLEHIVYKHIAEIFGGSPVVFKGMNAMQQGELIASKWSKFADPVGIALDLNRMDQHVSYELLQWEHTVYNLYYHSRKLMRLLKKQLVNKGVARCFDGILRYVVEGCRMSGDMNTALGNVLIVCAALYCCLVREVPAFDLANNGDDCIILVERDDAARVMRCVPVFMRSLGLPCKMEDPVDVLEHVDFCQTHPVFDGTHWTMVRDPRVCLDKDSCSLKPLRTEAEWNVLRNTVGMSGLALAGHMPVYREFYEALRRGAGKRIDADATPTGFKMLSKGMNMGHVIVSDEARASFFAAFDISPDEQIAVEEHYRKVRPRWCDPQVPVAVPPEGLTGDIMGSLL
jgi:hypothetical protein